MKKNYLILVLMLVSCIDNPKMPQGFTEVFNYKLAKEYVDSGEKDDPRRNKNSTAFLVRKDSSLYHIFSYKLADRVGRLGGDTVVYYVKTNDPPYYYYVAVPDSKEIAEHVMIDSEKPNTSDVLGVTLDSSRDEIYAFWDFDDNCYVYLKKVKTPEPSKPAEPFTILNVIGTHGGRFKIKIRTSEKTFYYPILVKCLKYKDYWLIHGRDASYYELDETDQYAIDWFNSQKIYYEIE